MGTECVEVLTGPEGQRSMCLRRCSGATDCTSIDATLQCLTVGAPAMDVCVPDSWTSLPLSANLGAILDATRPAGP